MQHLARGPAFASKFAVRHPDFLPDRLKLNTQTYNTDFN